MNKFLISVITIAVLVGSGSLFYYYVIFLPQQNIKSQEDISAIRNAIVPTPAQQQQNSQMIDRMNKSMKDYEDCVSTESTKQSAYLREQCASSLNPSYGGMDYFDTTSAYYKCANRVENSEKYKSFNCHSPFE